ncbi:MAG: 1-propanol dehydrogenase PduQ [bacterium]|nr:1-propanol dehydrogenase PduQ [bacterium]
MEKIINKATIYSGVDSLDRLNQIENKRVWLICDQFLVQNGSIKQIEERLQEKNQVEVFKDVVPDPPIEVIAKGIVLAAKIKPEVMIAYGGGSSIDTAKSILYFSKIAHIFKKVQFIAIPTTSGTGSEVTATTVITDQQVKHPVTDEQLVPDEVILCPSLTVSVPPSVTANTGMDVLTHAIEAYVSVNASTYSDALAEKACELVFDSLFTCYKEGNNLEARSRMQQASNLAGSAFNMAGLGMNHAIAHQIGGKFHIPHGLANSLLLTKVIEKNCMDCKAKSRYANLSRKLGFAKKEDCDSKAVTSLVKQITNLQIQMDMPMKLSECKVKQEDLVAIIVIMSKDALQDACRLTAPSIYNNDEIVKILLSIY